MVSLKKHPNHKRYLQALRRMLPQERLLKAFELSEFANQLFVQGLRNAFPGLSEEDFRKLLLERLAKCHNRNW